MTDKLARLCDGHEAENPPSRGEVAPGRDARAGVALGDPETLKGRENGAQRLRGTR